MNEFLAFIADIMDIPVGRLTLETSYKSISEWDSLMHLRLVAEIQDHYGIEIPIDKVTEIKTLADFYDYIEAN